ncbi:unnamed protein product [Caenorhabditis angaria]|uniref:Uncharacterized protein n=1 Tax=Caenorhabditis angaria TaxID=860376 RepID=A0A9P1IV79_9PELO|nr:unnamed protein product [Caenorhabditis angaria]
MNQTLLFLFVQSIAILLATSHFVSRNERSLMRTENIDKTEEYPKGMKEVVEYLLLKDLAMEYPDLVPSKKSEKKPRRIVYLVNYKIPKPLDETPTSNPIRYKIMY